LALHTVAAPFLRPVQRLVGAGERLHDRLARTILRHADGYGQSADRARDRNVERADALAQALRVGDRTRDIGMAADLDELLAAVASEDVGCAKAVLYRVREGAQHRVAGQVIEFVVVALEEIEIDHADRKRLTRSIGPLLRLLHRDEQRAAVV